MDLMPVSGRTRPQSSKDNRMTAAGLCFLVALLMSLSVPRNALWREPGGIWRDTTGKSPGKARPYYNLGQVYEAAGRLEDARAAYQAAVAAKPDYFQAQNNLGNVFLALGREDDAFRAFQAAAAARPDASALTHDNLGYLHFTRGRYDEAIREYRTALEIEPGSGEIRNNLGYVYLTMGRFDDAIRVFEQALAVRPDLDTARQNLARAVEERDRARGARRRQ